MLYYIQFNRVPQVFPDAARGNKRHYQRNKENEQGRQLLRVTRSTDGLYRSVCWAFLFSIFRFGGVERGESTRAGTDD